MTPKEKAKRDALQAKKDAEDTGTAAANDVTEPSQPESAPVVDSELGELITDDAPDTKAPADEEGAKHKGRTPEEIKKLGGGFTPGQPTRGPEAKNWKPPKAPVSHRMAGKPVRSAEEIRKLGGGLKPGTATRKPE